MRALFLLDHANIPYGTNCDVRTIVETWLDYIHGILGGATVGIYADLRAYGGWYVGYEASSSRFAAWQMYERDLPAVFQHNDMICRVSFRFADALLSLEGDSANDLGSGQIAYTVARRTPSLYLQRRSDPPTCERADCEVSRIRRWSRSHHACTHLACGMDIGDYFQRYEQKQVDVHLAIDLMTAVSQDRYDWVIVVSDDWDFLPFIAEGRRARY